MQREATRGPELRGHRSAPSHDLARVARLHSVRRRPPWLRLLCRTAAPLGAGTRQPRWPDRFFQARGSHGGSARGPRTGSACPRGGGPDSPAAPGAQLGAPGRGRCKGRTRWNSERRVCKARQGAKPAGHASNLAGAGSDTPAPRTRFKENSVGGEEGNKEKVKLGGGAAVSFCFPDLGRREPSLRPSASQQGPCPQPKGPRVLLTCRRPAILASEPTRVPYQCSAL